MKILNSDWLSSFLHHFLFFKFTSNKMAVIAPIVGTMKRKIIIDISVGFAVGGVMGYIWWTNHKKMVKTREDYYSQLAEKKRIEAEL